MLLELEQTRLIGGAEVLEVNGPMVLLRAGQERLWGEMALGYPYHVRTGDIVLAIGQGQAWYVIGIIRGTGPTVFAAPGDLRIHAPSGSIELMSRSGMRLRSSTVKIAADKLEFTARTLFERFTSATQWIQDALQLRAGRVNNHVEGDYRVRAGRITERAEGDVRIDGKKINLG